MKLSSLKVENFRNIEKLELEFMSPVSAFVGANAQGKTNILEAISMLAFGKSLRSNSEKSLMKINTEFFRLEGNAENKNLEKIKIEVASTKNIKSFKLNKRKINASGLVGSLPIVIFTPEDLNILLLSPSLRRRYLDVLLSQSSRQYLHALSAYSKALKNRNALLSRIMDGLAKEEELEFWDQELAKNGNIIGKTRAEFLEFAEKPLAENFYKIANEDKKLSVKFSGFHGEGITEEKYLENLNKLREQDLRYGTTNYGPHRQDLVFYLNDELLSNNGSRGEIRSTVLALKFTELSFIEKNLSEKAIFLLDDVFSELDRSRQASLMNMIAGHQTFITTTKLEHLDNLEKKSIWEMKNGNAKKI